jgi:alpha-galactosidase
VARGEAARRCENETCGRVFVHQLGGAQHGQYRSTGLQYCSPKCARMQVQRRYRRRVQADKMTMNGEGDGES